MNIVELRTLIVKNELPGLVILTGEEVGIQDVYIKQMVAQKGGKVKSFDTLADLWSYRLNTRIGAANVCIVRNDEDILTDEAAWKCLNTLKGFSGLVIVKFGKLDKRLKFGKEFVDSIVEFEKLSPEQMAKYIIKKLGCTQEQAVELGVVCNCDYLRAMLECDKIIRYAKYKNIENMSIAFDAAVADGVVSRELNNSVFEFVDMVVQRNARAVELWKILEQRGESGVKVLSLLFQNFRNVLIAQTDPGGKGVQDRTGLPPFLFFKAKKNSGHFSNDGLEKILAFLKDVEQGIKIGKYEEEIAVELVLANIL